MFIGFVRMDWDRSGGRVSCRKLEHSRGQRRWWTRTQVVAVERRHKCWSVNIGELIDWMWRAGKVMSRTKGRWCLCWRRGGRWDQAGVRSSVSDILGSRCSWGLQGERLSGWLDVRIHKRGVGTTGTGTQWACMHPPTGRNAVTERQTWQKEGRGSRRGPWGASPARAWVEKEEPAKKTGEEGAVWEGRAGRKDSRSRWTGCWRKAQPGEGGPRMHSLCLLVWQVLSSAPPPSLILSLHGRHWMTVFVNIPASLSSLTVTWNTPTCFRR